MPRPLCSHCDFHNAVLANGLCAWCQPKDRSLNARSAPRAWQVKMTLTIAFFLVLDITLLTVLMNLLGLGR